MGITSSRFADSSLEIGQMAFSRGERGRGASYPPVTAKSNTTVLIEAVVDYDTRNGTSNNVLGRTFSGVEFTAYNTRSITAPGFRVEGSPVLKLSMGDWNHSVSGKSLRGLRFSNGGTPFTTTKVAVIFFEASKIPNNFHFTGMDVSVLGSWQTKKGAIMPHILAQTPLQFNHSFTIK